MAHLLSSPLDKLQTPSGTGSTGDLQAKSLGKHRAWPVAATDADGSKLTLCLDSNGGLVFECTTASLIRVSATCEEV